MKVLVIHRPDGTVGGDVGMARQYATALRRWIDVDVCAADELGDLDEYEFAHVWAAVSPEWGLGVMAQLRAANLPYLLTPLYWPRDGRFTYYGQPADLYPGYKHQIAAILEGAAVWTCVTMGEMRECWQLAPLHEAILMGCGIPMIEVTGADEVDNIVLCVGRVERHKNQANLARACRALRAPLACIGPIMDADYAMEVRSWGGTMVGEMPHDETLTMLARARVHALASFGEVVNQATLEAAVMGTPCVISLTAADYEYFGPGAHYCDPHDWRSIRDAVAKAWHQEPRAWFEPAQSWYDAARRCLDWMEAHV